MKKLIITVPVCLLLVLMTSFTGTTFSHLTAKLIQADYAKVKDNLYLGKYEISNMEYRTFMTSLGVDKKMDLYKSCAPMPSQWKINGKTQLEANNYYTSESFDKYPVLTVTYEAALEYCKWLTEAYNSDPNREFHKILFRLPTEDEWTFAANGGDNSKTYTWGTSYMNDAKGNFYCQFKRLGDNSITFDNQSNTYKVVENNIEIPGLLIPGPVNSFNSNSFGLYNMCGNAAEMVSEKGIAKGGSYNDPGYDVRIASSKKYADPSSEIGFRVAMEIIKK